MSAVRQELLAQIDKLDEDQQRRLLDYVRLLARPHTLTWAEWLARADRAREELRQKYGDQHFFNSQSLLDEVREERLDDLLGGA